MKRLIRSNTIISQSSDTDLNKRCGAVRDDIEYGQEEAAYLEKELKRWFNIDRVKDAVNKKEMFFRLSRAEEYKMPRYNNECWEANESDYNRYKLPYVEELMNIRQGEIKWPKGKRFAVCLTHDMDILHYSQIRQRLRSLKYYLRAPLQERMIIFYSTVKHALLAFKSMPDFPIDSWMKLEDQFGFHSTMFFFAGPPAEPHYYDGFYHLADRVNYYGRNRKIQEVLPEIAASGWEVGLHGGINAAFNSVLLGREREILSNAAKAEVISGRQHYLIYDVRITPGVHENAGLLVDSSLGSNIYPYVYRAGTGLPYKMYDLIWKRVINVVQIPMIVQDVPLMHTTKGNIELAINTIVNLLEDTARRGTAITLSFHNNCFADDARFIVYKEILNKVSNLGAWGCSASELYNWFQNRASVNSIHA